MIRLVPLNLAQPCLFYDFLRAELEKIGAIRSFSLPFYLSQDCDSLHLHNKGEKDLIVLDYRYKI